MKILTRREFAAMRGGGRGGRGRGARGRGRGGRGRGGRGRGGADLNEPLMQNDRYQN